MNRNKRGIGRVVGAVALVAMAVAVAPGNSEAASIGGTDAQSQYNGFAGGPTDPGLFTFNDTLNGSNPAAEPGTVTTADGAGLGGLIGGVVDLDIVLDDSVYDPATGALLDATFIGAMGGADMIIWDGPAKTSVLLALEIDFIEVAQALPLEFAPPRGSISLGNVQTSTFGIDSQLTVTGGSFAAAVGGIGTGATLQILIADPLPDGIALADILAGGFWNDALTVGFNTNPTSSIVWEVNFVESVPEPAPLALLGVGLVALLTGARRHNR